MTYGSNLIAAERQRQIEQEGYGTEHDWGAARNLTRAAVCYALPEDDRGIDLSFSSNQMGPNGAVGTVTIGIGLWGLFWPWKEQLWKPTYNDRERELVKAGALIAAAIDSLHSER